MFKIIIFCFFIFPFFLFSFATAEENYRLGQIKNTYLLPKPIYEYNFTQELSSFGMEVGFWYQTRNMNNISDYFGLDFGLITNKNNTSAYSEFQFGRQFLGISVGPFADFKDQNDYGIQYTLWVNFITGLYFRGKHYIPSGNADFSAGFYIAIPLSQPKKDREY